MGNVLSKNIAQRNKSCSPINSWTGKSFFNGMAESFDVLQEKYSSKLPSNANINVAGKSVAISMEAPKLDPLAVSFSEQQDKIKQALQNLALLEKLVSENGGI